MGESALLGEPVHSKARLAVRQAPLKRQNYFFAGLCLWDHVGEECSCALFRNTSEEGSRKHHHLRFEMPSIHFSRPPMAVIRGVDGPRLGARLRVLSYLLGFLRHQLVDTS